MADGHDVRRGENDRRYQVRIDERGAESRFYAPDGPDGEAAGWPFAGRWYCSSMACSATDRWYALELIVYAPDGGVWFEWVRCKPPPMCDETTTDLDTAEIEPYEDDNADTLPGVTE